MNCQQIEQRIHELLDRRQSLESDAELTEHRVGCAECDQLANDFEMLAGHFASRIIQSACSLNPPSPNASIEVAARRPESAWKRKRVWSFAAIAATLLAVAVSLIELPSTSTTDRVAVSNAPTMPPAPASPTDEVAWPELLATIEELPRHWESLGPVYAYTAQMTGVSSLTSPLNLTMDWLKMQWSRQEFVPDLNDSQGRYIGRLPAERLA